MTGNVIIATLIRKKLREVLAHSSRTTEVSSLTRTFVPAHLKSENIDPTKTQEIDLTTPTNVIDRNIFKPKFRKNMFGRFSSKYDPNSEESDESFETTVSSLDTEDNDEEEIKILSSKVSSEAYQEESVIVPTLITNPIPSTKSISGFVSELYSKQDKRSLKVKL